MWRTPVRAVLRCDLLLVVVMVPLAVVARSSVVPPHPHEFPRAWALGPLAVAVSKAATTAIDEAVVLE